MGHVGIEFFGAGRSGLEDSYACPAIERDSLWLNRWQLLKFFRYHAGKRVDNLLLDILRIEMQVIKLVYFRLIPLVPELLGPLLLAFLIRIAVRSLRKLLSSVTSSHCYQLIITPFRRSI